LIGKVIQLTDDVLRSSRSKIDELYDVSKSSKGGAITDDVGKTTLIKENAEQRIATLNQLQEKYANGSIKQHPPLSFDSSILRDSDLFKAADDGPNKLIHLWMATKLASQVVRASVQSFETELDSSPREVISMTEHYYSASEGFNKPHLLYNAAIKEILSIENRDDYLSVLAELFSQISVNGRANALDPYYFLSPDIQSSKSGDPSFTTNYMVNTAVEDLLIQRNEEYDEDFFRNSGKFFFKEASSLAETAILCLSSTAEIRDQLVIMSSARVAYKLNCESIDWFDEINRVDQLIKTGDLGLGSDEQILAINGIFSLYLPLIAFNDPINYPRAKRLIAPHLEKLASSNNVDKSYIFSMMAFADATVKNYRTAYEMARIGLIEAISQKQPDMAMVSLEIMHTALFYSGNSLESFQVLKTLEDLAFTKSHWRQKGTHKLALARAWERIEWQRSL
jgi:hypothetical protein